MSKELRYCQINAAKAVESALSRQVKSQLIVMPGGTGKSLTAVNIVKGKGRVCWIAPSEELLDQACITLIAELELLPYQEIVNTFDLYEGIVNILKRGLTASALIIADAIGIIKADGFDINKQFVVASPQTLHKRLDKISDDWFNVIVADECDLFGSATFRKPLDYFKYDLLLGLTATPYRFDGILLDDIFSELVYEYKIEQAIADGYLTELNAIVVKTSTNLDSVHTIGGDFNQKELTEKVNSLERNNLIVNKYIEYCSGQQFICFGADVQHATDLCEAFNEKGIKTELVVSDVNLTLDRKAEIRKFRNGETDGLCNVGILSAGFDHPNTGCVILSRPTKSKRLFLQQLFRVTRLKDGSFVEKFGQIGTILDIVDGTSKHKLVNTHELDKGIPIEERVFLSRKNKDKLLEAKREREMEVSNRKEDVRVKLYEIPKVHLIFSKRYSEPATEAQLKVIERLGYDVLNNSYNKFQCTQIIGSQSASIEDINNLRACGYNISSGVTRAEAAKAYADIHIRDTKKIKPLK